MKKLFLGLLVLTFLTGLAFGQIEHTWEFDSLIVNGYTTATNAGAAGVNIPGFKNAYSVTVDPAGKIWCGSYYERRDEFIPSPYYYPDRIVVISGTDTTTYYVKPIYVLDEATGIVDTLKFLQLPGGSIDTLGGTTGSTSKGHRGMATDPDGNIIASFSDGTVYKINYQTYDVIAKYTISGGGGGRPGVDAAGYVYQMDGVFASQIDILDPLDWTSPFNTITGISAGVTRGMEVSPDGKNVYLCTQSYGVFRFHSTDGVFGTYTLADTLVPHVIVGPDTVPFYANLAQWHPSGLLYVATFQDLQAGAGVMWVLDPDQNYAVVDSLKDDFIWLNNVADPDTTPGGYYQPWYLRCVRDAYFNAAGDEFYAAEFYGYGIKKFTGTITGIQPGADRKEIPGVFTLYHNYPNPFNPTTIIPFELHKNAHVILRVYDVRGRHVGTYVDRQMNPGLHEFTFDGSGLASGQYFFKLTVDQSVATGKMLLQK